MRDTRTLSRHYEAAMADTIHALARMIHRYLSTQYPSAMARMSLKDFGRQCEDLAEWLTADDTIPLPSLPSDLLIRRAKALSATIEQATDKQIKGATPAQLRAMRTLCKGSGELIADLLAFIAPEEDNDGRDNSDHPRAHRSGPGGD